MSIQSFIEYLQNKNFVQGRNGYTVLGGFIPGINQPYNEAEETTGGFDPTSFDPTKELKQGSQEATTPKIPIIFDENDIKFLMQFPPRVWDKAMHWRYWTGIQELYPKWDRGRRKLPETVDLTFSAGEANLKFKGITHYMKSLFEKLFTSREDGGMYEFNIKNYPETQSVSWADRMGDWIHGIRTGILGNVANPQFGEFSKKSSPFPDIDANGNLLSPNAAIVHTDKDALTQLLGGNLFNKIGPDGSVEYNYEKVGKHGPAPIKESYRVPMLFAGSIISTESYKRIQNKKFLVLHNLGMVELTVDPYDPEHELTDFSKHAKFTKQNQQAMTAIMADAPFVPISQIASGDIKSAIAEAEAYKESLASVKTVDVKDIAKDFWSTSHSFAAGQKGFGQFNPFYKQKTKIPVTARQTSRLGISKSEYIDIFDEYFIGSKKWNHQDAQNIAVKGPDGSSRLSVIPAAIENGMKWAQKNYTPEHVSTMRDLSVMMTKECMDYCRYQGGFEKMVDFIQLVLKNKKEGLDDIDSEKMKGLYDECSEIVAKRATTFITTTIQISIRMEDKEEGMYATGSRREQELKMRSEPHMSTDYSGTDDGGSIGADLTTDKSARSQVVRASDIAGSVKEKKPSWIRSWIVAKKGLPEETGKGSPLSGGIYWAHEGKNYKIFKEKAALLIKKSDESIAKSEADSEAAETAKKERMAAILNYYKNSIRENLDAIFAQYQNDLSKLDIKAALAFAKSKASNELRALNVQIGNVEVDIDPQEEEEIKQELVKKIAELKGQKITSPIARPTIASTTPVMATVVQPNQISQMSPEQILNLEKNPPFYQQFMKLISSDDDEGKGQAARDAFMDVIQSSQGVQQKQLALILAKAQQMRRTA